MAFASFSVILWTLLVSLSNSSSEYVCTVPSVTPSVFSDLVLLYSRTIYLVPVRDHRYEIGACKQPNSHYSNQPPGIAPSRLMKSEGNWAALYTVAEGERCATKRGSSPLGTRLSVRDCLYEIVACFTEIAAQVQEIQPKSKVNINEEDHIGFDESGFFYSEIYVEGEDYDGAVAIGGRQTFTAPAAILNDVAGEDFDPFAEHRRSTIADREDEYRAMRWKLIISPEHVDSFAEEDL
ncbi:hypothetical protein OUZ56_021926 [Daphnia magna]|uniref:Uncharacterized protein n=1 Tax=Daphnia magna TaxID=35525 RepID=A0ABR0AVD6_9CRUS|nr:hypothetical protein OUZ56_021926 [Daphnia magna]